MHNLTGYQQTRKVSLFYVLLSELVSLVQMTVENKMLE